jgi:hypothetical protein
MTRCADIRTGCPDAADVGHMKMRVIGVQRVARRALVTGRLTRRPDSLDMPPTGCVGCQHVRATQIGDALAALEAG